jgi:hypothetical protein
MGNYRIEFQDIYSGEIRVIERSFISDNHARHYASHAKEMFEIVLGIWEV